MTIQDYVYFLLAGNSYRYYRGCSQQYIQYNVNCYSTICNALSEYIYIGLEENYSESLSNLTFQIPDWNDLYNRYNPSESCLNNTKNAFNLLFVINKFMNCTNDAINDAITISSDIEANLKLIKQQCNTYQVC